MSCHPEPLQGTIWAETAGLAVLGSWPLIKKAFQHKGGLIPESKVSLPLGALLLVRRGQALGRHS